MDDFPSFPESEGGGATSFHFDAVVKHYNGFMDLIQMTRGEESMRDLCDKALESAAQSAMQLSAHLSRTPDVQILVPHHPQESAEPASSVASGRQGSLIVFPATPGAMTSCPFEVLFDDREWLPCVILDVHPPSSARTDVELAIALPTCTVGILGYHVWLDGVQPAKQLRSCVPDVEALETGRACHAIHPLRHHYEPCVVERLTLEGTVRVVFAAPPALPDVPRDEAELPLSHVRLQPVHRELIRRDELRQRREVATKLKKEKAVSHVLESAEEWQNALKDLVTTTRSTPSHGTNPKKSESGATKKKLLF